MPKPSDNDFKDLLQQCTEDFDFDTEIIHAAKGLDPDDKAFLLKMIREMTNGNGSRGVFVVWHPRENDIPRVQYLLYNCGKPRAIGMLAKISNRLADEIPDEQDEE